MTDAGAPRVVLLSAPGEARERLQAAVRDAGAELVLVDDAAQVDAGAVLQLAPQAVVMVVDDGSEPALARLEPLLAESGISVLFEDADLIAAREGWDAARWLRHLSAKLHRHQDVLPPVPEGAVRSGAGERPDAGGLELAAIDDDANADQRAADAAASPFDPVQWEAAPSGDVAEFADAAGLALELDDAGDASADAHGSAFDAIGTEAADGIAASAPRPMDLSLADVDAPPASVSPTPAANAAGSGSGMFSNLSLVDDDADAALQSASQSAPEVTGASSSAPPRGAVVVFGGMGAPDAVRQLLGRLPDGFARPVLVRMQLQGGRYDKLVKQMGKATRLPVALAASGEPVRAGHVYFLAPDVSVSMQGDGLAFAQGSEAWPLALDPSDSALLLLSGSDAAFAKDALELQGADVLCLAQSADTAYDAAAANAWSALGGEAADPAGLVSRLSARWPA